MKFSSGPGKKKKCFTATDVSRVLILMTALAPEPEGDEVDAKLNLGICSSAEEVQLLLPPSLIILFGTYAIGRARLLERVG